jgi:integrase
MMFAHSVVATITKGSRGMAKQFIRGDKIWITYFVDKIRHRKSTGLENTKENIKIVEKEIIPQLTVKIATGEIYKKKPKTFEYYGSIFLRQKDANKSFMLKKAYFERVIEHFGKSNIDTITRLDIKKYLISLDMKTTSKSTYKSCLKEIFEFAVDDGVISFNPALNIKLKSDRKEEIQFYTKEDVIKLLRVADGIIKPYLEIAFNTGMRVGEILGLQIGDFKDDGYIHIKRTRTKGVIGNGKTYNAIRKVPYPSYVLDEVMKVRTNNIFIFGNIDDASLMRSQWKRVCKDANVQRYKLYSTRHTFATLMLRENIVSINELAGLLGHSSPKVTLEHYASVIQSKNIDLGANFSLFGHNLDTMKKEEGSKAL